MCFSVGQPFDVCYTVFVDSSQMTYTKIHYTSAEYWLYTKEVNLKWIRINNGTDLFSILCLIHNTDWGTGC